VVAALLLTFVATAVQGTLPKESNALGKCTTVVWVVTAAIIEEAWQEVGASFEGFCLAAGIAIMAGVMQPDAAPLRVVRYGRGGHKVGLWGEVKGTLGLAGSSAGSRVRARDGGKALSQRAHDRIRLRSLGGPTVAWILVTVAIAGVRTADQIPDFYRRT